MSRLAEQVREFHEVYGCDIASEPTAGSLRLRAVRYRLIQEEVDEFYEAAYVPDVPHLYDDYEPDLVGMADALGDIAYVVYGAALAFGIDLDAVVDEIHRSNMSKLGADGKPIYRADGKVLKGPNYVTPTEGIKRVLGL